MKQLAGISGILLLIAVGLALSMAAYVVDETQQVVLTQFGKPVGEPVTEPGLKLKLPFVQTANYFDKRFLEWDGDPNEIPTQDKRFIWVDSYARWRITDPLLFFQRLRDERGAQSRLDDILDGETRNAIAKHNLVELVRSTNRSFVLSEDQAGTEGEIAEIASGRADLEQEVLESASSRVSDLGIELLDFRFKRINYVEQVRQEVYARMISERTRIAEQYRSEGAGEAARISGEREREVQVIGSEAYRQAQEIKGRADAEAADIYAAAYSKDPEFYRFTRSLDALSEALEGRATLLMTTDGELMRYLDETK